MLRSVAILAFAAATFPLHAQVQKCVGPHGTTTFSDKACASAGPQPGGATPRAGRSGGAVDAPADIFETGVPVITQMAGRFAWLDADTLAITTFADPRAKAPWMVRKIVAFDMRSHAISTLVPRGFVDCTNAGYNLVGLEVGDLESRFAIGSASAPAVQQ